MIKLTKFIFFLIITGLLNSCNYFEKVDQRSRPISAEERRRAAVDEGRGIGIGSLGRNKSTNYEFSTSNPLWRATLETLDFLPLNTVDYSGGTIISDWYTDNNNQDQDSIKIAIRFLSNEIRSDSIKIIVHKKSCDELNKCRTSLLPRSSKINEELRSVILKKASILKAEKKVKK